MTRREWAVSLGTVCSPSFPADAVEAIVDMLPLLTDFSDAAFCADTVNLIGRMRRRQAIPALDEISAMLGVWQKERLPPAQRHGANPDMGRIQHEPVPVDPAEKMAVGHKLTMLAQEMRERAEAAEPERESVRPAFLYGEALRLAREQAGMLPVREGRQ
jgi:hypothetical protein